MSKEIETKKTVKKTKKKVGKKEEIKIEDICTGCRNISGCRNRESRPQLVQKCAYLHGFRTCPD